MSYATLDRCAGPECPRCGCQQAEILQEPDPELGTKNWWGTGLARCQHCGMAFHFKPIDAPRIPSPDQSRVDPPRCHPLTPSPQHPSTPPAGAGVRYAATTCPNCGSTQTRVTSSPRPVGQTKIRRHQCRECGEKFKSFEKIED